MIVVGDITLTKKIGKGSFSEIFLSIKKGKSEYFATKVMERKDCYRKLLKLLENESSILRFFNHPNILKIEDFIQTKDNYYILMEYINRGSLSDCLKKYQKKYNKAFSEGIIQYLMRQIVDAIKYIHGYKIIHRDIKLVNIMVNFDNENDKNNLNLLKAKIKIP